MSCVSCWSIRMTSQDQLPHITTVKDRAKSKLERDAREILSALQDPETVEIMVNADGRIWHVNQHLILATFRIYYFQLRNLLFIQNNGI